MINHVMFWGGEGFIKIDGGGQFKKIRFYHFYTVL